VSLNNFSPTYPGLRLLMQHRLHQVLHIQAQNWQIKSFSSPTTEAIHRDNTQMPLISEIPMKLDANRTPVFYVSAIALLLERSWAKPATEIAQSLVEKLIQTTNGSSRESSSLPLQTIWQNCSFEANSSGWITLEINNKGLEKWLELLSYFFQNLGNSPDRMNDLEENTGFSLRDLTDSFNSIRNSTDTVYSARNSTDLFFVQHAHARCCALLHLGQQENLIQPGNFSSSQNIATPLFWLDETQALRCQHPSEQQLILQICRSLDELAQGIFSSPEKTLRRSHELSQAFCRFYRDCLIFGEVKANQPALAQVRLGLVDVTRSLLRLFLEEGLGVTAPREL
jgi:DALR anticodon binding domain